MATNNSINTPLITPVTRGGTGLATVTAHAALVGNGTGALVPLAAATNGQLVIGSTGANPVVAAITAGAGISVTNGAGSVTIASTVAPGSLAYTDVTGTTQTMVAGNAYGADNAALVTLTLPATAAIGTDIQVLFVGAGGWLIAQNAGQSIVAGTSTTTVGVGGSIASTASGDTITFKCTTADTVWTATSLVGNLTVV